MFAIISTSTGNNATENGDRKMNNATKVTVKNGSHAGKVGFYDSSKVRNGKVIVMFTGRNMSGARLDLTNLEAL